MIKKYFDIAVNFIKKNRYYILLGIALFLFITVKFDKCSDDDIEDDIEYVDLNIFRQHIIDSIATEMHLKYISAIDSVEFLRSKDRARLNRSIINLDKENKELRQEIKDLLAGEDTMDIEMCIELVDIQQEIIFNRDIVIEKKDSVISNYKLTVEGLNSKYNSQYKETLRLLGANDMCQGNIKILTNRLEKQNTWWKRNEKWFYFGAGVIGTGLILK